MTHELPMVAEWEASGRVAAVFADIRRAFPYVPLVYRALAIQPGGLAVVWSHVRQVLHDPGLVGAARHLEQADPTTTPLLALPLVHLTQPRQDALRAIFSHFAQTLPAQLLAVTSVGLALAGDATGGPVPPTVPPLTGPYPPPSVDLVEPDEAAEPVRHRFRQVRALLGLPYIEAPWRVLASDPVLLETVWLGVTRHLARDAFHDHERHLAETVRRLAAELTPSHVASPEALAAVGCEEALPALRRLVALMAAGLLRHTVISLAAVAAIEAHPLQAA